jgi:hypothetical protein
VLPLVQRVMTAEQFTAVEAAISKSYPLRDLPFILGWAMYGMPDHARERMYEFAGGPYRFLHALVRRRFERGEARAFRYGDGGIRP